jgi:hypothetical protein
MNKIPLSQGKFALVDDEDYETLAKFKWHYHSAGYAARFGSRKHGHKYYLMHRVILEPPQGFVTDHINHDKLDNRRANLRTATHAQNMFNTRISKNNTSGYKGVSFRESCGKWHASASIKNKSKHIGFYQTPLEAHRAYCQFVEAHRGEFAST